MNEIVSAVEMKALEQAAFDRGVIEESLLEQAGCGLARAIAERWPEGGHLVVFAGKGHNAGDALVAARELKRSNQWSVEVRLAFDEPVLKPLVKATLVDLVKLGGVKFASLEAPLFGGRIVLLDGLLGIGAEGELHGSIRAACEQMNQWREAYFADVIAVDLPTGLGGENGVVADCTVTFGFPKSELLVDSATTRVGRLVVVPLPDLGQLLGEPRDFVITPEWIRRFLPKKRLFTTHKGEAGRVGIVAGSRGCIGAARLSAASAVRTGAGLVTLFVPDEIHEMAATSVVPEVMVRTHRELSGFKADAWGIGPGLGAEIRKSVMAWMEELDAPAVIDADALNWIAQTGLCGLESLSGKRLFTPHPGEMRRLLANWRPELSERSRAEQAGEFARVYGHTLLLKGSRTIIADAGKPLAYNSTGTPAMASGGMGDVLTGICAALMGQGLQPFEAGAIGSWILGRAGEIASRRGIGASYVIQEINAAFDSCRSAT